ncbi:cyclopropane-fatty-acyl-phospholipid synthase family protein [soil metagenome]
MDSTLKSYFQRAIRKGSLEVVDTNGALHTFGDGRPEPARVRFTSPAAERHVVIDPDLQLGQEYAKGGFVIERGSLYDFLLTVWRNSLNVIPPWQTLALYGWRYVTRHVRAINTMGRARSNIHAHYDLDGRLYKFFLDADMQYSCAYFEDRVSSLDEAQLAKKRHIAAKLALRPGMRVLDIGSGWGGLGLYLAEHCGAEVTGVTLSEEQFAASNRHAEERGLEKKVRFLLQDYRKVKGPFDRIVSVGMFEHVGAKHFRSFFKACRNLLTPDGVMLLHSIGRSGGPGMTSAWIQKYIFPGGYLPALSEVVPAIEKSQLRVTDVEILRLHYAKTLRLWRERFMAHREEVAALYDERFCRIWEFYLAASEVAFVVGALNNFQVQLTRQHATSPITRGYMRDTEEKLRAADGRAERPPLKLAGE